MKGEALFKALVSGNLTGKGADITRKGLSGLSKVYETAVTWRNARYDEGHKVTKAPVPVISVGNITVGGTGKTPMVRYVCQALGSYNPAVLSRGYKADNNKESIVVSRRGSVEVSSFVSGDEAWLLAKTLPNTSVVIGAKRVDSAKIAFEELGANVLVLDDGFQHRALARDLDIVLIDASNPFGYDHVLPRGLLREPLHNLSRADYIVLTKTNQVTAEELRLLRNRLQVIVPNLPVAETIHKTLGIQTLDSWSDGEVPSDASLGAGKKLLALSGIGQPTSFWKNVNDQGFTIAETMSYPDHHEYTEEDIVAIWRRTYAKGLDAIVTTEKDAVKLAQVRATKDLPVPVYVLSIGIEFTRGEDDFKKTLLEVAGGKA